MGIGWMTVLKLVPWNDVISNAPKIAEGAKKLWNATIGNDTTLTGIAARPAEDLGEQSLATRASRLEAEVADLRAQMAASSELIKSLADQNAQLIARIETSRKRLLWIGVVAASALLTVVALLTGMIGLPL